MTDKYILQNSRAKVAIQEVPYDALKTEAFSCIINPAGYENDELTKVFSIHIDLYSRDLTIATVGSHLSDVDGCALLEDRFLILMMNEQFFRIDVTNGTVVNYNSIDFFGCNFAIFKIEHGYVVHGEVYILFLNENFEETASFSGHDIFVSISGKEPFTLTKDRVQLYDFEDNYYEINFEGKLLIKYAPK